MKRKKKAELNLLSEAVAGIKRRSESPEIKKNLIPTGSDLLNLVLCGGNIAGTIINIVGDNSTGKTYVACELIAFARKLFGKKLRWFFDDAEAGFSFSAKDMYGFEILPENEYRSDTVQEFANNLKKELTALKKDELLIYVLDTWDSLTSDAEIDHDVERMEAIEAGKKVKGTYGMDKQKFASEFFRLRKKEIKNKNCLLIIISQVRENINVTFGAKYRRNGGKALDFYSSIILWLAEVEKLKRFKMPYGITVKAKTTKGKIARPFRSCFIELIFDYGIDNISSNIKYLYDYKTDLGKDKDKAKVKWNGKSYSIPLLIKHIENKNLEDELKKRVIEKWEAIEEKVSTKGRKSKWK